MYSTFDPSSPSRTSGPQKENTTGHPVYPAHHPSAIIVSPLFSVLLTTLNARRNILRTMSTLYRVSSLLSSPVKPLTRITGVQKQGKADMRQKSRDAFIRRSEPSVSGIEHTQEKAVEHLQNACPKQGPDMAKRSSQIMALGWVLRRSRMLSGR